MLTPKLNPELAEAKNALRQMLMTKIKHDFEEGPVETTFESAMSSTAHSAMQEQVSKDGGIF